MSDRDARRATIRQVLEATDGFEAWEPDEIELLAVRIEAALTESSWRQAFATPTGKEQQHG